MRLLPIALALLPLVVYAPRAFACDEDEEDREEAAEEAREAAEEAREEAEEARREAEEARKEAEEQADDEQEKHVLVHQNHVLEHQKQIFDRRIGVRPLDLTPELREFFGAPEDAGVMIARVERNSPAERAGLKVGDIITRAGGETIDEAAELVATVDNHPTDQMLSLELIRNRSRTTLEVRVEEVRGGGHKFDRHNFKKHFSFERESLREELRALREHLRELHRRLRDSD